MFGFAFLAGSGHFIVQGAHGIRVAFGMPEFVIGTAAVMCPIRFDPREAAWPLGFGVVTTLLTFPRRDGLIPDWRGLVLLGLYAAFAMAVFRR